MKRESRSRKSKKNEQTTGDDAAITGVSRPCRKEILLIATIVLLGTILRFAYPSRMAVEHFDEGVYASNIWFGEATNYQFPNRHLYAPPLLPYLIEWSVIFFGPGGITPMLVSLVAGCGTVALVWWVARDWFGPVAGLASATLAATSDIHILYSRTALTDVLMCFWLVLAVWLGCRAVSRGRFDLAVAAGFVTGLAWWTKYNGWLPLAIIISGGTAWSVLNHSSRANAFKSLLIISVIVLAAGITWLPFLSDLQQFGGYASVADNHGKYVVGFEKWFASFQQQLTFHRAFDGWPSAIGLIVSVAVAIIFGASNCRKNTDNVFDDASSKAAADEQPSNSGHLLLFVTIAIFLGVASLFAASSVVLFSLAVSIPLWLIKPRRSTNEPDVDSALPIWILIAWIAGLSLTTPLYHPYPRLTLPWLVAIWFAAGVVIADATNQFRGRRSGATASQRNQKSRRLVVYLLPLLCFVGVVLIADRPNQIRPRMSPWQHRTGSIETANEILRRTKLSPSGNTTNANAIRVLYVFAEPGILYYLNAEQKTDDERMVVFPVADLSFSTKENDGNVTVYLITGPHAESTRSFVDEMQRQQNRFERIATYPFRPSDLVLSNRYEVDQWETNREQEIVLYRLK